MNATASERLAPRPGDHIVGDGGVTMNRAFTVSATPEQVWPWLLQLGKGRAGWYFPRMVESVIPPSRRGIRHIDPQWQNLRVGDIIPDYGGARGYFEVADIVAPHTLVYQSARGGAHLSWAIILESVPGRAPRTRVCLRLRLNPVRRRQLARLGELVDVLTVAGMAAGLRERLAEQDLGDASPLTAALISACGTASMTWREMRVSAASATSTKPRVRRRRGGIMVGHPRPAPATRTRRPSGTANRVALVHLGQPPGCLRADDRLVQERIRLAAWGAEVRSRFPGVLQRLGQRDQQASAAYGLGRH